MTDPTGPLFGLRLRTPRLELRLPNDEEIVSLAAVARAGIHPPGEMPFAAPWSIAPSPDFERGFLQHHQGARTDWSPADWHLALAAFVDGTAIGSQSLLARDFMRLKAVHSGSWLGLAHQGRGLGTEMRTAVLALAFDGLGAEIAETEAFFDNLASAGVSRRLGYEENGIGRLALQEVARDVQRYRLTAERWRTVTHAPVSIEGLAPCLELFGAAAPRGA